jgi:hypothetical protein
MNMIRNKLDLQLPVQSVPTTNVFSSVILDYFLVRMKWIKNTNALIRLFFHIQLLVKIDVPPFTYIPYYHMVTYMCISQSITFWMHVYVSFHLEKNMKN